MIAAKVDLAELIEKLRQSFQSSLVGKWNKIEKTVMENVEFLADANYRCYVANMTILEERRKKVVDTRIISDMELQARIVGEQRVRAKAAINSLLSSVYPPPCDQGMEEPRNWTTDDIVYSIGEMIDRLTIERIKAEDYALRIEQNEKEASDMESKIELSRRWSSRVCRYFSLKLQEISRKEFYEAVSETRTYDLTDITGGQGTSEP